MVTSTSITTVIFDIGEWGGGEITSVSVCDNFLTKQMLGINKWEKAHGLPHDYLNVAITARGPSGAFQRLEVGELQLPDFYEQVSRRHPYLLHHANQFGSQMSDLIFNNAAFVKFCSKSKKSKGTKPLRHTSFRSCFLWKQMMLEASTYNLPIIKVIKRLRESGKYRVAALTNNFQLPDGKTAEDEEALGLAPMEVKMLFDQYIESSQVGLRKPDLKFFEYALKLLKVGSPKEVVFLDDLGINLKAAKVLGINTIKVGIYDVTPALVKLQQFLPDVDLSDIINSPKL
ncbi:hypothetical protein VP01_2139g3 [Puccinia sorghi]|uniref:Uncharacterized protein n=1 Tax=Puccinia sorghi TaxID=27349 RepID=A0A0L6V9P0_9BASI|nr:hypothetical protein VP01_2139g3 [Puccinia sorghi]